MKITFFKIRDKNNEITKQLAGLAGVEFIDERLTAVNAHLAEDSEVISVFTESEVTREAMDKMPKLKLIAAASTGVDHIDLEYAKARGIAVTNAPAYGSQSVAEFTFGLILNLSRKICSGSQEFRQGIKPNDMAALEGFDLEGKTLAIIGTGKIGANVIRYAKAFDLKILAFDIFENKKLAAEIGFTYVSLSNLLAASDIISLHVPLTQETRHLINANNINLIKRGAIMVNTARGEIIETKALLEALKQGILAGAALDVIEGEKKLQDNQGQTRGEKILTEDLELLQMPNVLVTPHMAYNSREANARIRQVNAENIAKFLAGSPQNQV